MPTYAELHETLEAALKAAQRDLAIFQRCIESKRRHYGPSFDCPERRVSLTGRIAELELNLEALEYEQAAWCAAFDPTE